MEWSKLVKQHAFLSSMGNARRQFELADAVHYMLLHIADTHCLGQCQLSTAATRQLLLFPVHATAHTRVKKSAHEALVAQRTVG